MIDQYKKVSKSLKAMTDRIQIENMDGLEYLSRIPDGSVDLVLTDPPYIISRDSGMNSHYNKVEELRQANQSSKTEEEWAEYKQANGIQTDDKKENFLRYGTIYGTKYCVRTQYGDWDTEFTMDTLEKFVQEFYKKLRQGGTVIVFFDSPPKKCPVIPFMSLSFRGRRSIMTKPIPIRKSGLFGMIRLNSTTIFKNIYE